MKNYNVYEGQGTVYDELRKNPEIQIGDTIEFISNNQQGYQKYKVIYAVDDNGDIIINEDGIQKKGLELIDDYDMQMERASNGVGGKIKRKQRKTNKHRKTYKRRKSSRKRRKNNKK